MINVLLCSAHYNGVERSLSSVLMQRLVKRGDRCYTFTDFDTPN